ncbi:error-prone DNA polymerase [Sphingomonas desiccabilis]|uniref:Error-prone DNA polymerase n=1 Tax=Sphingomonas desiccabilis TaxID=429134 RepID=A0A4Q2IRI8_9SPHN|nr:error-prone DNA polymerase [Sphingomonas desiccabilis]MBB3912345.1 error-prone DNA polymerase [Sphingomonas desiccabilis]RXZ30486.1 DNA polymerase III subunit alpha [Sphingomonas desiccabilis]
MTYSELQVTTHFSFLRGASSAEELFGTASEMGMPALGITDRNSVAGIVRSLVAAREVSEQGNPIRLVVGCRLDLVSGASLLVWPEDLAGWSRLTRLLTLGKKRADPQHGEKGQCFLHWDDLADTQGLVGSLVPGIDGVREDELRWMADLFGSDRGHVCLTYHRRPGDRLRLHRTAEDAARFGLQPLATGDVLYHKPERRMLQDVVTAIRCKCTIDDLGLRRERSADRCFVPPRTMERRFADLPEAIHAGAAIVERCTFSPTELSYRYPDEIVMHGRTPQEALEQLARKALDALFQKPPFHGRPDQRYIDKLDYELEQVRLMDYAAYFLTVNSIVTYARAQDILCQGRGSAANSVICYVLGITSIDPVEHQLLFERFISPNRGEPPDIDVDFEHERREEVIQWIYQTYGHDHAALTAVVSRFRARGAVREVGKALGLPEDMTGALAGQVWGWSSEGVADAHVDALNLDRSDPRLALTLELARELIGTPRHLSQHPGGFVLARDRLDGLVPVEPAAMADRWVVEWEKEDIEELNFMKVDILGLGMLGCMRRAFDLLGEHKGLALTLASPELQKEDPATFAMIQRADTLGVFQIESRAQMAMLPRMLPETFYDIAIQVAIVRPGPIQGDMVHPYLKRREQKRRNPGIEFDYPSPRLKAVLEKTLGVPLFQEQAMKVAIEGAGFTPARADELRKAMATFKYTQGVGQFREELIAGMNKNGISEGFADRLVKQIEGFGSYGFPESHAASFAKIAYASSWMKCHHPDVFCAALLNAQPMGFYAPAQIVRDAREHGVEVRPVCINDSRWDTRLLGAAATGLSPEAAAAMRLPLRLGFKVVHGLSNADAARLVIARGEVPFTSVEDAWRRSGVPLAALEKIARADGFQALGLDRRQALWAIKGLAAEPLPLFAAADARAGGLTPEVAEAPVTLEPLTAGREVVEDYRATQLSLRAHPLTFLRGELDGEGVVPCKALGSLKDGRRVEVAGVILVRQKPGSAKGVLFITIEDETGVANAILWPDRFEKQRRTVMSAAMVSIVGRVQREGEVIHVITDRIVDRTPMLRSVGDLDLPRLTGRGDGATHGSGPDPRDPREPAVWKPRSHYHPPFRTGCDPEDAIPIRSRDFH